MDVVNAHDVPLTLFKVSHNYQQENNGQFCRLNRQWRHFPEGLQTGIYAGISWDVVM